MLEARPENGGKRRVCRKKKDDPYGRRRAARGGSPTLSSCRRLKRGPRGLSRGPASRTYLKCLPLELSEPSVPLGPPASPPARARGAPCGRTTCKSYELIPCSRSPPYGPRRAWRGTRPTVRQAWRRCAGARQRARGSPSACDRTFGRCSATTRTPRCVQSRCSYAMGDIIMKDTVHRTGFE